MACVVLFGMPFVCSCEDYNINLLDIDISVPLKTLGTLSVINLTTHDTISVYPQDSIPALEACNGNTIKLVFEPAEDFKDSVVFTDYLLPDGTIVKNEPVYEYGIENRRVGKYMLYMKASKENVLSSLGTYNLIIIE